MVRDGARAPPHHEDEIPEKSVSNDIDELAILNRDYVASVQNCDVKRFDEILAQDFYCTNPDKPLVDRAGISQANGDSSNDPQSHRG
jgi:hypothetical protein